MNVNIPSKTKTTKNKRFERKLSWLEKGDSELRLKHLNIF